MGDGGTLLDYFEKIGRWLRFWFGQWNAGQTQINCIFHVFSVEEFEEHIVEN